MKILLLKGISQYGAMRNYIDQWNYILRGKGHETYILDMGSGITLQQMSSFITSQKPQMVLACNGICGDVAEEAVRDFGKYVTVFYDNPVSHAERLAALGRASVVFSCDRFYADHIRDNYPDIGQVGFLPLSGNSTERSVPWRERRYDLIFTGSYFPVGKLYDQIRKLPSGIRELAVAVADDMLAHPSKVLWESMDGVLEQWKVAADPEERKDLLSVFRCVDIFVRAYVRDQVMHQIVDHEIPVHIFGNGWDKFQTRHQECLILHKGYGEKAMAALADSRLSLNVMPWFRAGIQERNIAAMLAGAVSVTDSSRYIEECFTDGEDIVLYSLERLEELPGIIEGCLQDVPRSERIAKAGYEKALRGHTWEHRIGQLLREVWT